MIEEDVHDVKPSAARPRRKPSHAEPLQKAGAKSAWCVGVVGSVFGFEQPMEASG
jgi:hypothetical protein